ncbi:PilZ domain-containing protein [Vibrio maritimus]|uniref:PilZ domain-containing protein n=1 Tax=Vibrio maritimus TaxID=990268 RepID=UPI0040682268
MEWGLEEQNKCYRFLKPGMKLSLTSVDNQQIKGMAATLIGFKPSAFLIVDVSQVGSEALGELTDGDLVVRGLSDSSFGHVIAFRSRFISRADEPCQHLFLAAPSDFVSKPIREHSRYKLSVPCNLSFGQSAVEGKMVDFSLAGCGVYIEGPHDFCKGLALKVECPLNQFLPAGISFEVVTVKKQGKGTLLGIQFNQQVLMSNRLKTTLAELSLNVS